jgi:hypothetical protein
LDVLPEGWDLGAEVGGGGIIYIAIDTLGPGEVVGVVGFVEGLGGFDESLGGGSRRPRSSENATKSEAASREPTAA